MQVGVISDTHGYMDDRIRHHLFDCDLIIHAGDVGDVQVLEQLSSVAKTTCVYGNIDDQSIRKRTPLFEVIQENGVCILVIHIAGSIGKYNTETRALINTHHPDVLIRGHSHILKIAHDERFKLMHINPGAAGRHGFHKMRTLVKFKMESAKLSDLQIIELGPRSAKSIY